MTYKNVVEELNHRNCKRILVTGSHRAGTTFSGYAFARELAYLFYKEENIKGGNLELLNQFHKGHGKYVLQAPGFSERCHLFPFDAVIFVRRNEVDILSSMRRLSNELIESQTRRTLNLLGLENSNLSLPALKLKAFEEIQAPKIENAFILDYESWVDHPLFIKKTERKNFHLRQITKKIG